MDPEDVRLAVSAFDAVSPAAALEVVRPLCGSPVWMDAMVARRPYGSLERVLETSATVLAGLTAAQRAKAWTGSSAPGSRDDELIAHVARRLRRALA